MSFSEKINLLQNIYRKQHDLSNQISGASFAEDRGYLSEEDKKEVVQKQNEYAVLDKEEVILRENIIKEFPEEYKQYLEAIHARLTLIQNYLNSITTPLEFKQSFNKTLCESLLPDLSKFIQSKKIKYTLPWIFDVSLSLIEDYKNVL